MSIQVKDVLHYGAAVVMIAVGGLAEAHVMLPGISVMDPEMVIAGGLGILGVGAKADKALRSILFPFAVALALLGGNAGSAYAADLKAAPLASRAAFASVNDCTQTDCSGAFVGANLAGIGTSLDVLGSGVTQSIFGGGGLIGAEAEYQLWNGKYFASFGAMADYEVNINGLPVSQNRVMGAALVKAGIGLSGVFAAPPSTSPIAGLQGSLLSPYAIIGAVPFGHQGWISGAGMAFALSPTWKLSLEYLHVAYKAGTIAPGALAVAGASADNIVKIGLSRKISN